MLELFLKVPPLKKLEFQNQKKDYEICTKRKFRTKNQSIDWKLKRLTLSIRKQTRKGAKLCASNRQELEGWEGSKTFFRVLECLSKIPNIKKISNEHFNLWEAEISLDKIIKFRWNHKILKLINLQLMMALQQNFKRVLLNCAPSFIHLHPAHYNLHPAPSPSTQLIVRKNEFP